MEAEFITIETETCKIGSVVCTSKKVRSAFIDAVESHLEKFSNTTLLLPVGSAESFFYLEGNRSKINRIREVFSKGEVMLVDKEKSS